MKTMTTKQFSCGVTRLKHTPSEVRMLNFMKKHGDRLLPSRRYGQAMGWKLPKDSANLHFGLLAGRIWDNGVERQRPKNPVEGIFAFKGDDLRWRMPPNLHKELKRLAKLGFYDHLRK
jgi:hypothetical protein